MQYIIIYMYIMCTVSINQYCKRRAKVMPAMRIELISEDGVNHMLTQAWLDHLYETSVLTVKLSGLRLDLAVI